MNEVALAASLLACWRTLAQAARCERGKITGYLSSHCITGAKLSVPIVSNHKHLLCISEGIFMVVMKPPAVIGLAALMSAKERIGRRILECHWLNWKRASERTGK